MRYDLKIWVGIFNKSSYNAEILTLVHTCHCSIVLKTGSKACWHREECNVIIYARVFNMQSTVRYKKKYLNTELPISQLVNVSIMHFLRTNKLCKIILELINFKVYQMNIILSQWINMIITITFRSILTDQALTTLDHKQIQVKLQSNTAAFTE